jgi:diguanylate cyclase (GGDEF)-like protein/PAS domain S-box-containing protein
MLLPQSKATATDALQLEKILVVDDVQMNLDSMEIVLKKPNWKIYCVNSGEQALAWLLNNPDVSLILMDVQMPSMDGFTTASLIRENIQFQDVPILFISANANTDEYISHGFAVGASDYLLKPIDNNILIQRVELFLNIFRSHSHLQALTQSLTERYEKLLLSISDAVLIFNKDNEVTSSNLSAQRIFGYDEESFKNVKMNEFIMQTPEVEYIIDQLIRGSTTSISSLQHTTEINCVKKNKATFPAEISINFYEFENTEFLTVILRDMSERKAMEDKLYRQATHDALTDLPNRYLLLDRISQSLMELGRNPVQLSVLCFDFVRFKLINDSLGHDVGDQLLKMFSARLQDVKHENDTLVRYGGDEFVLVTFIQDQQDLPRIIDTLKSTVVQPFVIETHSLTMNISIGVTMTNDPRQSALELIKQSEAAMYKAKELKHPWHMFSNRLEEEITQRLKLENQIKYGIENNQFILFYQPKYNMTSNEVNGFEALIRWQQEDGNIIGPGKFIQVAEESQLIVELGNYVLLEATSQALKLQREYAFEGRISVNVSGIELNHANFSPQLEEQITQNKILPHLIEIELTETAILNDPKTAKNILLRLKELGFTLALDDFGTGYSSLTWLFQFPYDTIKIDRQFVNDAAKSHKAKCIVKNAISLAHDMDLDIVAEGIETEEQDKLLRELGCDIAQGYLYSQPISVSDIASVLRSAR